MDINSLLDIINKVNLKNYDKNNISNINAREVSIINGVLYPGITYNDLLLKRFIDNEHMYNKIYDRLLELLSLIKQNKNYILNIINNSYNKLFELNYIFHKEINYLYGNFDYITDTGILIKFHYNKSKTQYSNIDINIQYETQILLEILFSYGLDTECHIFEYYPNLDNNSNVIKHIINRDNNYFNKFRLQNIENFKNKIDKLININIKDVPGYPKFFNPIIQDFINNL